MIIFTCSLEHGAVRRRLLSVKTARPKLLSANATVTKCKMDWNTVSTARTFWNFSLYYKTLLHSEAFTELHVYSCKRMGCKFESRSWRGELDTALCDKVSQ